MSILGAAFVAAIVIRWLGVRLAVLAITLKVQNPCLNSKGDVR